MKKLFPANSLTAIYRRENNLKEILSPSLFPPKFNKNENYFSDCNKLISAKIILYLIINLR